MISLNGIVQLFGLPFRLLWCLLKYPFFGGINGIYKNNLRNTLKLTFYRFGMKISVKDSAYLTPTSSQSVIDKLKSLYPKLTNLNSYGKSFDKQSIWLVEAENRSKSDPIIIYLHGGGYFMNTAPDQLESVLSIYHLLEKDKREKTSVLVLDYSLACRGHYIGSQLYELAATYANLDLDGNNNIILLGDSAGGHLAITFLQYLKQEKEPKLPWPKSTILISPWLKVIPDTNQYNPGSSYVDNDDYDMLHSSCFQDIVRQDLLLGGTNPADMLISPGNLPYKSSDWSEIPTFNAKGFSTFVILGEREVMRDEILKWLKYAVRSPIQHNQDSQGTFNSKVHEYKSNGDKEAYIEIVVEAWGIHDAAMFFENEIIKSLEEKPQLKLSQVDDKKYFGVVRTTKFLNRVLRVEQG